MLFIRNYRFYKSSLLLSSYKISPNIFILAKEMAQNQMMNLVQTGNIYEDFSGFLRMCQENELDNPNHSSIAQRPESLDLKTGNMVNEMGSLLKLLSDIKVDVNNDTSLPNHISTRFV